MELAEIKNKNYSDFLNRHAEVTAFFDDATNTVSYVVADQETKKCAVVDSVMDYEPNSGTVSFESADKISSFIKEKEYKVEWILETHVHADHMSAAPYLQDKLGGKIAIGEHILEIQELFGKVFNEGTEFARDGSQFDRLFKDGDEFAIGSLPAFVLHTPGHTSADVAFVIGDSVFVGDTLFMPDYGTARVDFPGGSAEALYTSVQKLFALPDDMRAFMCHDYLPEGREEYKWESTIGEEKDNNIHINKKISLENFKEMRAERDKKLGMPRLIIPSLQVNMRAGDLPAAENGEQVFLKVPINSIFSKK